MADVDGLARGRTLPDPAGSWDRNLTFAVEKLAPGTIPVWMQSDHYEENAKLKEALKLKPDWAYYFEEQRAGRYFLITARDPSVVGYWSIFIRRHPHYSDCKVAIDDAHYLMPSYRNRGWGKKMLAFVEQACIAAGATIFSMRCKADQDHGHLFEQLGYTLTDKVYLKELPRAQAVE